MLTAREVTVLHQS